MATKLLERISKRGAIGKEYQVEPYTPCPYCEGTIDDQGGLISPSFGGRFKCCSCDAEWDLMGKPMVRPSQKHLQPTPPLLLSQPALDLGAHRLESPPGVSFEGFNHRKTR